MIAFNHILVPIDFGPASEHALDVALDLASKFGSKITLLHSTWMPPYYQSAYAEGLAWPVDELELAAKQEVAKTVERAKKRHRDVDSVVVIGETWTQIIEIAKSRKADLIVMGTHGRRGISRVLLGSVAEKVVRLAPIPVLTVPAEKDRQTRKEALAEISTTR